METTATTIKHLAAIYLIAAHRMIADDARWVARKRELLARDIETSSQDDITWAVEHAEGNLESWGLLPTGQHLAIDDVVAAWDLAAASLTDGTRDALVGWHKDIR